MLALPPEFELGGHRYRTGELSGLAEAQLLLKTAPIIAVMKTLAATVSSAGKIPKDAALLTVGEFAMTAGSLPLADTDYIMRTCLSAVERQGGREWEPVWDDATGDLAIKISGPEILVICGHTILRVILDGVETITTGVSVRDVLSRVLQ